MRERHCFIIAGLIVALGGAASGVTQTDIAAIGGDRSRTLLGTGQNVTVAVLDGGIDANHPALRGSVVLARDFTGQGTVDDSNLYAGHGTPIASLFVGHDYAFTGLAPSAYVINARINNSNDYTNDRWAGNGLFFAAQNGAKVVNLSIGADPNVGPVTDKLNLMVDYASERYGLSVVSAAGNEKSSAVNYSPGGAYNGYSVGALASSSYVQVSAFSNFATPADRRTKPDIVAPGTRVNLAAADWEARADYVQGDGTSFSAPMVGGVIAQMYAHGKQYGLSTSPMVLKAVLLSSAEKVYDTTGDPWSNRHQYVDPKGILRIDEPLDAYQGAGRLNAVAAYQVYTRHTDAQTPVAAWKKSKLAEGDAYMLHLGDLDAGQRVDATLTWLRHVGWNDRNGNGAPDGEDEYYQRAGLADFALQLIRDGKRIIYSDSDYDNVEHLSFTLRQDGDYWLRVYRWDGSGLTNEPFAVAARVLDSPPSLGRLSALSPAEVFADGVSRGLSTVPEPSALLPLTMVLLLARRSRRRIR